MNVAAGYCHEIVLLSTMYCILVQPLERDECIRVIIFTVTYCDSDIYLFGESVHRGSNSTMLIMYRTVSCFAYNVGTISISSGLE